MRTTRLFQVLAVATLTICTRAALADSAGAWAPLSSSDAAQLSDWGYAVFNTDSSSAHTVVEGLGFANFSNHLYSVVVYGNTNGGTGQAITCWLSIIDPLTGNLVEGTNSSGTTAGPVHFTVTATSPSSTLAPFYLTSVRCQIPKANANGNAFIIGSGPLS
jgi:hypothetical protein